MLAHFILMDFAESDDDGLYTLLMLAAVAIAVVLVIVVMRLSRASDRHLHTPQAVTTHESVSSTTGSEE